MWKTNKVPDKELAPSTLGHRRPFEYWRVPRLGLSLLDVVSLHAPEGNSAGKRKERHGEAQHWCKTPKTIFQNQLIYPKLYIKK